MKIIIEFCRKRANITAFLLLLAAIVGISYFRKPLVWENVSNFVCYYGGYDRELENFQVAFIDADKMTKEQLAELRKGKTYVMAYLSLGVDDKPIVPGGSYEAYYIKDNGEPVISETRGQYFVDAGNSEWQSRIVEKARQLIEKGCDGLFMDALDTAENYPETAEGMTALVRLLSESFPESKLVANGAFSLLSEIAPYIHGVMFEEFNSDYVYEAKRYLVKSGEELEQTQQTADFINELRKEHHFVVFTLDYAQPTDKTNIRSYVKRSVDNGFVPYASVIGLDRIVPLDVIEDKGVK